MSLIGHVVWHQVSGWILVSILLSFCKGTIRKALVSQGYMSMAYAHVCLELNVPGIVTVAAAFPVPFLCPLLLPLGSRVTFII